MNKQLQALVDIAKQPKSHEIIETDDPDFEGAYNDFIDLARQVVEETWLRGSGNRLICTTEHPMPKFLWKERTEHPEARSYGETWDGSLEKFKCPACGLKFTVEIPQ